MKKMIVSVILILLFGAFAEGATIFVSPGQSIQAAIDRAGPGDEVIVKPGTYPERLRLKSNLTVKSEVNRKAILDGSSLGNGTMVTGTEVSNVEINGFHITRHTGGGIQFGGGGENIRILNNEISWQKHERVQGHAIVVYGMKWVGGIEPARTKNVIADGNYIHDVQTGVRSAFNEALTFAWDIEGCQITNNVLERTSMIGIDLIGKVGTDNWIAGHVRGPNTIAHPRKCRIAGNRLIEAGTHSMDVAIYLDGSKDVVIEDNYMEGQKGHGIVTSVEGHNFTTENVIVRRNISVNGVRNFAPTATTEWGKSKDVRMSHNTSVATIPNRNGRLLSFYNGTDLKVLNNVFYLVPGHQMLHTENYNDWATGMFPKVDGNCWWIDNNAIWQYEGKFYNSLAAFKAGTGQGKNAIGADPQFVNIGARDFSLKSGSPCMNSGLPLTTTPSAGSGNVVTVEDAHWFTDGYGFWDGDVIQVGKHLAKVVKIDYNLNRIELDRSIAWSQGTPVSYPHVGGIDRGAVEHGDIPDVDTDGTNPVDPVEPVLDSPIKMRIIIK